MKSQELYPKIETKENELETYTDFKKRYYIYRVDDIVDYLQRDNTELDRLFKEGNKISENLRETLTPEQKHLLSRYSDNWFELLNEQIDELTQYMLKDFEEER